MADQGVGVAVVLGVEGVADAGGDLHGFAIQGVGAGDAGHQTLQQVFALHTGVDLAEQQHKFVAAKACHTVIGAQGVLQALGHQDQQPVAGVVAQAVVDGLEAIQVQVDHAQQLLALARLDQGFVQARRQLDPIRQPGQGVKVRQLLQAVLLFLLGGDIQAHAQHAHGAPMQVVAHHLAHRAQPARAAMRRLQAPGDIERAVLGVVDVAQQLLVKARNVVAADQLGPVPVLAGLAQAGRAILHGQVVERAPERIAGDQTGVQVPVPAAQRGRLQRDGQQGFALADGFFLALLRIDVLHHAAHGRDAAVIVQHGFAARAHPQLAAIGAQDLDFQLPVAACAQAVLQLRAHAVAVLGHHKGVQVVAWQRTAAGHAMHVVADVGPVDQSLAAPVFPGAQARQVASLLQLAVEGVQLLHGAFVLAHVVEDEQHALFARHGDRDGRDRARHQLAPGLAQDAHLVDLALEGQLVQQLAAFVRGGVDLQLGIGAADDLLQLQPHHAAERRVDVHKAPIAQRGDAGGIGQGPVGRAVDGLHHLALRADVVVPEVGQCGPGQCNGQPGQVQPVPALAPPGAGVLRPLLCFPDRHQGDGQDHSQAQCRGAGAQQGKKEWTEGIHGPGSVGQPRAAAMLGAVSARWNRGFPCNNMFFVLHQAFARACADGVDAATKMWLQARRTCLVFLQIQR